jgi:hypothetical protein
LNRGKSQESGKEANQRGTNHDKHEGQIEEKSADKGRSRERDHQLGSQHLPADSNRRFDHNDQDGWL